MVKTIKISLSSKSVPTKWLKTSSLGRSRRGRSKNEKIESTTFRQIGSSELIDKNMVIYEEEFKLQDDDDDDYDEIATFYQDEIQVGKLLGEGHFCEVYEVTGIQLVERLQLKEDLVRESKREACKNKNDVYAIKLFKESSREKVENSATSLCIDLGKEAKLISMIHHKNIIQVHGFDIKYDNDNKQCEITADTASTPSYGSFLIMEQLRYTLDEKLEQWKLRHQSELQGRGQIQQQQQEIDDDNENRLLLIKLKTKFALHIAEAISYLHENRIIFRDLKPQNIGFKDNETIKIFDFGLSRIIPDDEEMYGDCFRMTANGSPRYMAPEVFISRRYNGKADVYSWSLVYYHMLSLEQPYSNYSLEEIKKNVSRLAERPKLSSLNLPQSIIDVLKNGWCHHVPKRYIMKDICKELGVILNEII